MTLYLALKEKLFQSKYVFSKIGYLPDQSRSGGYFRFFVTKKMKKQEEGK
jgi:hypothetical protein